MLELHGESLLPKSQELVLWFNGRTFALHGKASQKLQKKLSKFTLNDLYQNNNKIHGLKNSQTDKNEKLALTKLASEICTILIYLLGFQQLKLLPFYATA